MPISRTPTAGARTQSISNSETDRISSVVLLLDSNKSSEKQSQSPILSSGLIETPLGVGLGTRFQTRNNPRFLELQDKAERVCRDLKKDIEIWMATMKASPSPELLTI